MVSLNTTLGLALWVCGLCICSELHTQKGLALGLMLCCCHLEIPNRYSTRGPVFSFCNVADPDNTIFRGMKQKVEGPNSFALRFLRLWPDGSGREH